MDLSPADRFDVPVEIAAKQLKDETVILDLAKGIYFGLNPVGSAIWDRIETGNSLAEICDAVSEEYDTDRATIEADVMALVRELLARGLIEPRR